MSKHSANFLLQTFYFPDVNLFNYQKVLLAVKEGRERKRGKGKERKEGKGTREKKEKEKNKERMR